MTKDNFLLYGSFYDAICDLPESEQLKAFHALCRYGLHGEIYDEPGVVRAFLRMAMPNIDAAHHRYEVNIANGKKGGRPKKTETEQEPNNNPTETETKPTNNPPLNETQPNSNHNDNVNANVDVDVEDNADADAEVKYATEITDIVSYLNEKATTKYRANTPITQKFIRGRLSQGYTVADFRYVIDVKCAEWLGTEWEKYLRPDTLFREGNFEKYLQQKMPTKSPANQEKNNPSSFTNIPQDNNYSNQPQPNSVSYNKGAWGNNIFF